MILKTTSQIVKDYETIFGLEMSIVFIDIDTDEFLGFSNDGETKEVLFVHREGDYKKIWDKFPNAVRLGEGETTPFDKGIIGYIEDGEGNGRILYEELRCCEAMSEDYKIEIYDAFDDFNYNTIRSLPYIEEKNRPYIMAEVF